MKTFKLLFVVTLQLASFCTSTSASTEPLAASTSAVPFQLISPAQYQAILELNNGNPFISQNRLISGGSEVITDIINNIVNGLITPVNITGLDPINNSLVKPSVDKTQGYPFCTIQTNRNSQHSQRSYDAIVDPPGSNFGTFSINFYHPGTVNIDNYDEDLSTDELEPSDYRPSTTSRPAATVNSNPAADSNKDKPNSSSGAPVINCIVVLKEPSPPATPSPAPTPPLPPTPTPTQRPPKRPSYYPHQYPTVLSHPPRDPHYSIGPYQIIPIPYPPFLGLLGPAAASSSAPNWANWPNTPTFPPSSNPNSAISPTWPYWPSVNSPSVVAGSQGMKGPGPSQTAAPPTWPYLTTIPSQAASTHHHHVPATLPFNIPSSFWTAINPNAAAENVVPYPNPAAWYRPPSAAGAFNPNQLMQQQQQIQYNEDANEIRSVLHDDETAPEDKENQGDSLIEEGVQNSRKILQSRRMGEKRV